MYRFGNYAVVIGLPAHFIRRHPKRDPYPKLVPITREPITL
jgi:hypothetical protein